VTGHSRLLGTLLWKSSLTRITMVLLPLQAEKSDINRGSETMWNRSEYISYVIVLPNYDDRKAEYVLEQVEPAVHDARATM
jgi:hypothetical protein